jgi:hypothetical protein
MTVASPGHASLMAGSMREKASSTNNTLVVESFRE